LNGVTIEYTGIYLNERKCAEVATGFK